MDLLVLLLSLLTGAVAPPEDPTQRLWAARVIACLGSGTAEVLAADEAAGLLAFSCGTGHRRLVVMANGSAVPQRVARPQPAEPLVAMFATRGDLDAIPALLITLYETGGVAYSNEVPPHTAVVFRPAEPGDLGSSPGQAPWPKGLKE